MGWLENLNAKQREYIRQKGIKQGDFVHVSDCFKGVYYEVAGVWNTLVQVYVPDNPKTGKVKTDLIALYRISEVYSELPADAYSVCTSKAHYSERLGTIGQINPHYGLPLGVY